MTTEIRDFVIKQFRERLVFSSRALDVLCCKDQESIPTSSHSSATGSVPLAPRVPNSTLARAFKEHSRKL